MIQYEDFSLKIEPRRGDLYPVIVLRSPAGEGRSQFKLPFDPDELGNILVDLGEAVRSSAEKVVRETAPGATRTRPQQIGDQLFSALFAGPIRSLLDRSLGMLHGSNQGLRVKLHIDPEDASLARLTSLPWELMYRKETREFLNLSSFTPILRYLDVQVPCIPLPLEPPLRILGVIANPLDYPQLDLARERRQIEATWAKQQDVAVDFLQPATILGLQERLAGQPYHALHFMGHGGFDRVSGSGVLLFEDEHGRSEVVDGSTLGVLLRDAPTLRLVFLNACETACVSKQEGLDPFAGVAAAMVMAGIPAVVAMQFPITDGAAIRFANRFYSLLAAGQPVDYAVAQGRQAILATESGTMEWATPVLFMRAPEGAIFKVSRGQQARRRLSQPATVDDVELAQQFEERYTAGLGAFWLEEWDKAVRCFEDIVAVQPDYQDVAAKLEEARRWQKWDDLYTQAQAAQTAGNWDQAIAALTELVAEKPDFRDAAELLAAARRRRQLADLYAQAGRLHKAAKWQAVVNVFAQIRALDPNHADPDGLFAGAQAQVAQQERLDKLGDLFGRAVRELDAGRWPEARELLVQVQADEPGFRGADRLLACAEAQIAMQAAARQRKEQIAGLYKQAQRWAGEGQWVQAQTAMKEIRGLEPEFTDPQGIAARAQAEIARGRKLDTLYAQAQAALSARDWSAAVAALRETVGEDAGYRDAAALLAEAKRQQKAAGLYAEAQEQHRAGAWTSVVETFDRIAEIARGYADPEGLLPAAQAALAEQQHLAALEDLYERGVAALEAADWEQARLFLGQVQERAPGYREAAQLADRAEAEIARERAERQRRDQIGTLYEQALSLASARQWRPALAKVEEVLALDAGFTDPEGIAGRARVQVAQEEAEAQRQNELAAFYAEAVHLLKAGQYQEALETWGQVQARDPRYPDRKNVQATARKKLASLARPATVRRLPGWVLAAAGALVLVATVVAVLWWRGVLGGGRSEQVSTPAPAPVAIARTDTPQPSTQATRPTSTGESAPAVSVQGCAPGVLFCENFENGQAQDWKLDTAWRVEESGGDHFLSGSGHKWATLDNHSWSDYRVQFRVRLLQGGLALNYRITRAPVGITRYYIGFMEDGLSLSKSMIDGNAKDLVSVQASHPLNIWHKVEIAGRGGHIQVLVNGQVELDHTDPDPLPSGSIAFESWEDSSAQIDDIEVLPATEPGAAVPVPPLGPNMVFSDDFETGQASRWGLEPGWRVEQEGDNYVLSGENHQWANLHNLQGYVWENYTVRFRVKLEQGAIHLNFRHLHEPSKGNIRYYAAFGEEGLILRKEVFNEYSTLTASTDPHELHRWYTVAIIISYGHSQVFVDGARKLDYEDPKPLAPGGISFETVEDSHALVDDVEIWAPWYNP